MHTVNFNLSIFPETTVKVKDCKFYKQSLLYFYPYTHTYVSVHIFADKAPL